MAPATSPRQEIAKDDATRLRFIPYSDLRDKETVFPSADSDPEEDHPTTGTPRPPKQPKQPKQPKIQRDMLRFLEVS